MTCFATFSFFVDKESFCSYNLTMNVQNILLASESFTHSNWNNRNISAEFSRLYYIIDGEAYYEENSKRVRLKKNHLYLTPVKKCISLYDNPNNKLLHTYTHIVTIPAIKSFAEIEVVDGTPLADGVTLWRKYIHSKNKKLILGIVQFIVSCIEDSLYQEASIALQIQNYIDSIDDFCFNMEKLSREMGYCREYMTRQFRMTYHMTPLQYFNGRKMNASLERLLNGVQIREIAQELNYSSAYAFSKAFKKYFGLSPEKYRKSLTEM